MDSELQWSGQFTASPAGNLRGDKIVLPQSALEQLLTAASTAASATSQPSNDFSSYSSYYAGSRQPNHRSSEQKNQLPHPLTFRLVNANNGRVVYAGIREFSAEEGCTILSSFLWQALDLKEDEAQVTIHARQIPKGTFVKLRPLEAGYDPDDWKALLEQHLRSNYTTLTKGEVLVVPGPAREEFRFLIDSFKPESDAVCVVDTDLEVDIEALNEEQARETIARIAQKIQKTNGSEGSSAGGDLDLFRAKQGQISPGDYIDYQLPSWPRSQAIEIEVEGVDTDDDVDLLVSPFSAHQRNRPRLEEHVFGDFSGRPAKRIRLEASNAELEDAEALWISVHVFRDADNHVSAEPRQFTVRVKTGDTKPADSTSIPEQPPNPEDVRCKNCGQWVPQRTLMLHENFCLRNNVLCPQGCGQVFQKRSPALEKHWHCPHDTFYGNSSASQLKHNYLYHPPSPFTCTSCSTAATFSSLPQLAHHKTSVCPAKTILCRFCHLSVPQEGDPDVPNAEALLSGLTPHELADGSRTTECHLCSRIPRLCRNTNCGRTLDGTSHDGNTRAVAKDTGNDIGLCAACFGPLYVSTYDPENKALKRRIERRYLTQLLTGCGKSWCCNTFCKTGRTNTGVGGAMTTKDALPMIKPYVDAIVTSNEVKPLHFCVDEPSQIRRTLAEMLKEEHGMKGESYALPWCIGALEAENGQLDKAREWLGNWAPTRAEEGS
ncbi:ubiquitin fusion degradation protein [Aureobasidium subglaciale]|nr:ubiquitin fusion degradation protein [Aureobasidium subglaciale]KAI5217186.1 ubiquitin fusion degradation protein [Aureobasidium subglaciale]KAI5220494.1 ubiquitin fusion degradation protein [Aureobasidium subglaciale]KAI5258285.1 ubiquitin fusion degradation protein [Aureobasidium subglaciale]